MDSGLLDFCLIHCGAKVALCFHFHRVYKTQTHTLKLHLPRILFHSALLIAFINLKGGKKGFSAKRHLDPELVCKYLRVKAGESLWDLMCWPRLSRRNSCIQPNARSLRLPVSLCVKSGGLIGCIFAPGGSAYLHLF